MSMAASPSDVKRRQLSASHRRIALTTFDDRNLPYHEQMPDTLTGTAESPPTAALTAEQLG